MATNTSDIYNALMNPWLFYSPVEQNFRTPGFTQAMYWADPAQLRAVPEVRADPTVAPPPPPPPTAAAALRGVFPSRATNDSGGSQNGGDTGAGLTAGGDQGLAPPGGYGIPVSDILSEFTPFGQYQSQNWPEMVASYALGAIPGMVPGVSSVVGNALDFTPGPTAQRDFGTIGAVAQREAEDRLAGRNNNRSIANDPFNNGMMSNGELGWGLANRAADDMSRATAAGLLNGVYGPPEQFGPQAPPGTPPANQFDYVGLFGPVDQAPRAAAPSAPAAPNITAPAPGRTADTVTSSVSDTAKDFGPGGFGAVGDVGPGGIAVGGGSAPEGGDKGPSTGGGAKGEGGGAFSDAAPGTSAVGPGATPDNSSAPGSEATPGGGPVAGGQQDTGRNDSPGPGGGAGSGAGSGGGGDIGTSGGSDPGPGGKGDSTGGGGKGDGGGGWYARGGPIRRGFMRGNPPGPDNRIIAAETGEYMAPRGVVQGIQAGNPQSAAALIQGIRAGQPPVMPSQPPGAPPMAPGSALAALRGIRPGALASIRPPQRPARAAPVAPVRPQFPPAPRPAMRPAPRVKVAQPRAGTAAAALRAVKARGR